MIFTVDLNRLKPLDLNQIHAGSRGSKTKRKTKEDLERGCGKGLSST